MIKKTWIESRCNFDNMIWTNSYGYEYKIEVKDGVVQIEYSDNSHILDPEVQKEYQEYIDRVIEEELLGDK